MDPVHSSILDRNKVRLAQELDVQSLVPHLRKVGFFQEWHEKDIQSKKTDSAKRQHCLKLIKTTRGPEAFQTFYKACCETSQHGIAEILKEGITDSEPSPGDEEMPNEVAISAHYEVEQTDGKLENLKVTLCDPDSLPSGVDINNLSEFNAFYKATDIYPNFSKPKGLCIIFNNRKFAQSSDLDERIGTDVDAFNADKLFKGLGYKVTTKQDLKAEDMMTAMRQFARKDHSEYHSAVVVILSHGQLDQVYGTDGEKVPVEFFTTALDAKCCPNLKDKPKLYIIQACRGDKRDAGVHHPDGPPEGRGKGKKDGTDPQFIFWDFDNRDEADMAKVPVNADTLMAYATTPGYISWRNSEHGSWFIQTICKIFSAKAASDDINTLLTKTICKIFSAKAASDDIHTLLTKVNSRVAKAFTASPLNQPDTYKQMPESRNRLLRTFYFFPGLYLPSEA